MKRSLVLLAPLVVAAAIFAALVLGSRDDPAAGSAEGVAVAPVGGPTEPEAGAADLSAPDAGPRAGREAPREVAEAPPVERPGPASGAVVPEATEVELLVVSALDDRPVAGAEVRVVHTDEAWENFDGADRGGRLAASPVLRTDGAGRVTIPLATKERTWVEAHHETGLWGGRTLPREPSEVHRLELERDLTLRARVRDTGGAPIAGIPVALRSRDNGWAHDRRELLTDGDGAVAFLHAQRSLRNRDERDLFSLAVDALFVDSVEHRFDPERPPREEVELVVHPTGQLVVRVYGPNGEESRGDGLVSAGIVKEGQPRTISPFSAERRDRVDAPLRAGVARFSWVDVGQELEVEVLREGADVGTVVYARGPTRPGEEAEVAVTLGADHPVLAFRAVEPGGEPITDDGLEVRVDIKTRHSSTFNDHPVSTDGEGRFLLDIGADWSEGIHRTLTVRREREGEEEAVAFIDLSRSFPPGITDMGDLVLDRAPILVAGRVVDGGGAPVPGARLSVGYRQAREDASTRPDFWNQTAVTAHVTDAEGRFEIRDRVPGSEFRLVAKAEGRTGSPVPFLPGEEGLVVRLLAAGTIQGRVLLDPAVPPDLVEILLAPMDAPDLEYLEHWERNDAPDDDGTFGFVRLLPGTYRATVRIENGVDDLEVREPVLVLGGEDTVLADVDLRGRLHVFRLELVTPDPKEDVQGEIRFTRAGADEEEEAAWRWFSTKDVVLASPHPSLDVRVEARGYRPADLVGVAGDTEVLLRRGIQVRVVLRGTAEIPPPPNHFKAALVPAEGDDSTGIDWGAPCFDESRESVVAASEAGRMRVVWILEKRTTNSAIATTVKVEPDQFVEIEDIEGEQTVTVTLSQEQLTAILEAL